MLIGIDGRVLEEKAHGGVKEYTEGLLRALLALDKQNRYVIFTNKLGGGIGAVEKFSRPNVIFSSFSYPNKLLNFSLLVCGRPNLDSLVEKDLFKKTGKREKLDIFWAPNLNFIRLAGRARFVLTVHDVSFLRESDFFSLKERLWHALISPKNLFRQADALLPVSSHTSGELARLGFRGLKMEIVKPGIDQSFFETSEEEVVAVRKEYGLPERFILTLAAKGKRKNLEGAIKAFRQARLSADLHFVIAGEGTELLPRDQRITGLGAVPDGARRALYKGAEFFVYPSFYEGFGLPVLEAAASGTPVITSSATSLPEILGNSCLLINPHDLSELRSAMELLAHSYELRARLSQEAKRRVRLHSWEDAAKKLLEQFKK